MVSMVLLLKLPILVITIQMMTHLMMVKKILTEMGLLMEETKQILLVQKTQEILTTMESKIGRRI